MQIINQPIKSVAATVTTEGQYALCFFYSDTLKQDSIDFIREIARLHDNSEKYNITVKMYDDFNKLDDKVDFITEDIINAISFVGLHVDRFLRG